MILFFWVVYWDDWDVMYVDTFKYEPSLYYGPSSRDFDPQYEEDGTARPASKKSTNGRFAWNCSNKICCKLWRWFKIYSRCTHSPEVIPTLLLLRLVRSPLEMSGIDSEAHHSSTARSFRLIAFSSSLPWAVMAQISTGLLLGKRQRSSKRTHLSISFGPSQYQITKQKMIQNMSHIWDFNSRHCGMIAPATRPLGWRRYEALMIQTRARVCVIVIVW